MKKKTPKRSYTQKTHTHKQQQKTNDIIIRINVLTINKIMCQS